ncbi:MAG: ankyrin repeat domain-containing protein [Verrucomicrobiota bacterium]|jgi:ankyrin repeat protein|nr:ankyrin repeat domain-containing protein [Verrucomicrobiota bacterium]
MKHLLLTTIAAVVLAEAGFADAIHDAAFNGNIAVVRTELNKAVDVNAKDADGNTPLDMAIYGENSEIAELLIINGADVNLTDEDGYNPLDKALTGNKTEIAAVLRAHGAVEEYAPNNSMDTGTTWLLIIGWSLGIVLLILSFLDKGRRGRRGGSGGEGGCGGGCGGCGGGGCGGGE